MAYSPLNDLANLRPCAGWTDVLIAAFYRMVLTKHILTPYPGHNSPRICESGDWAIFESIISIDWIVSS